MPLFDLMFGCAAVNTILGDRARLQRMLDFEAALARAEAHVGVIPMSAADAIAASCDADRFDLESLAHASVKAGNPAIPLVKELTALVARNDREAARFVHVGATSQDAIDTGFVLSLRDALVTMEGDLERLCTHLAGLADRHRSTPVAARTWLQHAVPSVFGLKIAGWLDAVLRHQTRLCQLGSRVLVLQFGGAAGTLAALGDRGLEVAQALAEELKLELPVAPWHSHRDRVAEVATVLALLTGTLGKIARDISLYMQTEVGEVFEPAGKGRGGSSTMPHKRNPVTCALVLAAAQSVPGLTSVMLSAMSQEHERGLGGWHAEWETLSEIIRLSAGALHHLSETVGALEVDTERMRQNLEVTRGLIYAEAVSAVLSKRLGKAAAHQLVEGASHKAIADKQHLRDVLATDPAISAQLNPSELERLFEPSNYTGVANNFIDRVLQAAKKVWKDR